MLLFLQCNFAMVDFIVMMIIAGGRGVGTLVHLTYPLQ